MAGTPASAGRRRTVTGRMHKPFCFACVQKQVKDRSSAFAQKNFQVEIPTYAQSSHASQGPTFGGGNDLQTFTTSGLALSTNPHSYPTEHPLFNTSVPKTEANFQLEVLQVSIDPDGAGELEAPWLEEVTWAVEVQYMSLQIAESEQHRNCFSSHSSRFCSACVMASILLWCTEPLPLCVGWYKAAEGLV